MFKIEFQLNVINGRNGLVMAAQLSILPFYKVSDNDNIRKVSQKKEPTGECFKITSIVKIYYLICDLPKTRRPVGFIKSIRKATER
jgi:hypothetical protein